MPVRRCNLATTAPTVYKSCGFFMSPPTPPAHTEPQASASQAGPTTLVVIKERPQGSLARGSYVWPAWGVVLLVVVVFGLVLGNEFSARRQRKAQK